MRDDIKELFEALLLHLDDKIRYTGSLLENVKLVSCCIKSRTDNKDEILKIVNRNNDLIDKINVEDYDISAIKDEFTRRFSLDTEKFFSDTGCLPEKEIAAYREKIYHLEKLFRGITEINRENYTDMINEADDLKQQISELARMSRINIIFPAGKKL